MRPVRPTPAHKSGDLAELVCSNSLRSDDPLHAAGLLKREMEAFGSLIIGKARDLGIDVPSDGEYRGRSFSRHARERFEDDGFCFIPPTIPADVTVEEDLQRVAREAGQVDEVDARRPATEGLQHAAKS